MTSHPKEPIVFGKPHFDECEENAVRDVIRSGWWGTGPKVQEFRDVFAEYKNVESEGVAMVSSCTAALHLSLLAEGIGPGDEVITTAMTFASTVNTVLHSGATPVLVDIDSETKNIDYSLIEKNINEKTKAVVAVHFAGYPLGLVRLRDICDRNSIILIEDCAHAIETKSLGVCAGTVGDYGCFSFYSTKNISTVEGGAVICRDKEKAGYIRSMSLHGMSRDAWARFESTNKYSHYDVIGAGYKYNLTDLYAAIGLCQMSRVDQYSEKRKKIFDLYLDELADSRLSVPNLDMLKSSDIHAYHLFTAQCETPEQRDEMLIYLGSRGVGVGVHYRSISDFGYISLGHVKIPEKPALAEYFGRRCISLPLSNSMELEDALYTVECVKDFYQ